jgi:cytochrome c peroxidase
MSTRFLSIAIALSASLGVIGYLAASLDSRRLPPWELENPIQPLSEPPLGMEFYFKEADQPPIPARVRLGRWLFYDTRLSADDTISCASCHRPEHAFSEPSAVSTGINGRKGNRKAPALVNLAVQPRLMTARPDEKVARFLFRDGRARSLEEQVSGPIESAAEMGNSHAAMIRTLSDIPAYKPYFKEAFGTDDITRERVAAAIADYERTRMSGNSPYDRWRFGRQPAAVPAAAKLGHDLFSDKARCSQCHSGSNFTDGRFHSLGVGWNAGSKAFTDEGRYLVTRHPDDRGAFKTPGLRDVSRHAPYMHDGSIATLREVVELYNRGGIDNPYRSASIVPLGLAPAEIDALVAFLRSLDGEGYQDVAPKAFPR